MVTRRAFLQSGVVWTGLLWVPKAAAQQSALAPRVSSFRAQPAAGDTLQDSYEWQTTTYNLLMSNNYYYSAYDFYPGVSFTLHQLRIWCEQTGTPTMTATPYIYSDSSGSPGSAITGGTGTAFALNTCPASGSPASFSINGFTCALTSGTRYWLTMYFGGAYSISNTVKIYAALKGDGAAHAKQSDAPPTWANMAVQQAIGFQAYGV